MKRRPKIPRNVRDAVLIANRHCCCVCRALRVQIHHIDSDPSNNDLTNLAVLCFDHHDMATVSPRLSQAMSQKQVRHFKREWEEKCGRDISALSRSRIAVYLPCYKNPPRIAQLFLRLSETERKLAVKPLLDQFREDKEALSKLLVDEPMPFSDSVSSSLIKDLVAARMRPSGLPKVAGHPRDGSMPYDFGSENGAYAFYLHDYYYQLMVRAVVNAYTAMPIEDLRYMGQNSLRHSLAGRLCVFNGHSRSKKVPLPDNWEDYPLSTIQVECLAGRSKLRASMLIKTMYIFSTTTALELNDGDVTGVGVIQGYIGQSSSRRRIRIVPLLIGLGRLPEDEKGLLASVN